MSKTLFFISILTMFLCHVNNKKIMREASYFSILLLHNLNFTHVVFYVFIKAASVVKLSGFDHV